MCSYITIFKKHKCYLLLSAQTCINRITLVNRKGCCQDRLRNFYIKLLDDKEKTLSEKYITHTVGERETFTFAGGLARYVKIEMPARSDGIAYIQLAEVEVYGELTGKCLKSQVTYHHAQKGMRTCDDSMELLLGNLMSVGTLQAITKDIEENGVERIPGFCCLDMATTSQYLGENVSNILTISYIVKAPHYSHSYSSRILIS